MHPIFRETLKHMAARQADRFTTPRDSQLYALVDDILSTFPTTLSIREAHIIKHAVIWFTVLACVRASAEDKKAISDVSLALVQVACGSSNEIAAILQAALTVCIEVSAKYTAKDNER